MLLPMPMTGDSVGRGNIARAQQVCGESRPAGSRTMLSVPQSVFASFRLDPGNACVWRGPEMLPLTPKAFTVLQVSEPYTRHRTCLLSRYRSVRGASYHKAG